jgi:hypothetical protein
MGTRHFAITLALVAGVVFPACSRAIDAYFANPCRHELRIEIHRRDPGEVDEESALKTIVIPAGDVKLVEGAFGNLSNSVSLLHGELPFEVDEDELLHATVVLPWTYCEA